MGVKKALAIGLFVTVCPTYSLACNVPDGAASLLKLLDDYDRGLRNLKLSKAKTEELSNKGRQSLIANHIFLRDMDCSKQTASRPNLEEELSVQRRIIRQNDEIIEELRRRR